MVIALGTDVVIAFDVRAIQYGLAFDTFFPQTLGHIGTAFAFFFAHSGWQYFVNPAHGISRFVAGIINGGAGN